MRICCYTIDDFVTNISHATVYQKTVYAETNKNPLNGSKRDACSFGISVHVSAVLEYDDGGQALLEATEECGIDRLTSNGDLGGSELAKYKLEQLSTVCERLGLRVRPGILDM